LRDDAGARVLAQCATQLVVQNGAPRIMSRFKPGRCNDDVARVRQRDRAAAKGLNGEQKHERDAFQHGLLHTPTASRVLPRA